MCGIAIIIEKKGKVEESVLRTMTDMVKHRGPDGSGVFIENSVGLGHRRLAIIDLTESGKQPMFYKDLTIVHNGEIYNYIELREELKKLSYDFHSTSDTEVILAAYHAWGDQFVQKLRGMWAFAIYDRQQQKILLSRDRFGIKPLHYTATPSKFLAGSEIKQFTAIDDFEAKMFHPIVYEFLHNGILNHNEYSFYKDVFSLKPGHNLIYDVKENTFRIDRWYDLENIPVKQKVDKAETARRFRECFEEAVKIHLRSDVKLGSCLSGGIDSSSIVSMTRHILGKEMPLYTVTSCNDSPDFDEKEYADAVVSHCRTSAIFTRPDLNSLYSENILEKITYHQDQPIQSGSHFSEYKVFEEAGKNKLIVMLDGQGSDEYLAGYHNFFLYRCKGLLAQGKFGTLFKTISQRAKSRGMSAPGIYKALMKMVLRKRLVKFIPRKRNGVGWLNEKWAEVQRQSPAATYENLPDVNNLHELTLLAMQTTSIPYQLHSEDRNSMTFSIESRVPFLDHVLVESMIGLPEDNYYDMALDKIPVREGLKDILPQKIYNRKTKLGFASSDEIWMKEHATEVRERLRTAIGYFPGILNNNLLSEFDRYVAGETGYNYIFFRILALYAWAKATNIKLN